MDNEKGSRGIFGRFVDLLLSIGLGETMLRLGTAMLSIVMVGMVVWLLQAYYARPVTAGTGIDISATEPVVGVSGIAAVPVQEIGRASCRERVYVLV